MTMMNRLIIVLIYTFLLGACAKETAVNGEDQKSNIYLSLAINTLADDDPMSINEDQTFSSLALYIFNDDANFSLDKFALLPSFTSVNSIDIPIKTQEGGKIVYLVANYSGKTFKLTSGANITLSETTTKDQLDDLIVVSASGFLPNSLLMLSKKNIDVTEASNGSSVAMSLRRLQARVDVHVYKGDNFGTNNITLESVVLVNQVLNSESKFDDPSTIPPQMLTSPMLTTKLISNNSVLSAYVPGEILEPKNAQATFYSYQNIVSVFSPIQSSAPYLEITINSNGVMKTYTGYFTDLDQTSNKYSLLQNNVYQIKAIIDIDSKLILNVDVLPWDQTDIEYERPILPEDFSFGEWGNSWGGINAMVVHTNNGQVDDAVFEFELAAPMGAAWTATLTNGLDFMFTDFTAGTSTIAVSKGFAGSGNPAIIAVRAAKKWKGSIRKTEFYITVEGVEIPINPLVGLQRKYEGTDTRIIIKQVASSN